MASPQTDIVESMRYLRSLPSGLHWLCPRSSDSNSSSENSSTVDERTMATIRCMELFSDPDDNPTLEDFKGRLLKSLSCQFCVKAWHHSKKVIRRNYESEYPQDVLDSFIENIDTWDYHRIHSSLSKTELSLKARQPGESALKSIDNGVYVAIYDCMFVPHLLDIHSDLAQSFTTTFSAIQEGGRHMGMAEAIPAIAAFLFVSDQVLRDWAIKCLQRMSKPIGPSDYDMWLHRYIERAVNNEALRLDPIYATRLWRGLAILIGSLDKSILLGRIAGSDYDIFRAQVSHLQSQTQQLLPILASLKVLLLKTETDYWETVSSMPPIGLLEYIFNNPQFDEAFSRVSTEADGSPDASLSDLTDWITPFITSLKLSTRPQACASLLFQLFERLQDNRFPIEARQKCISTGLEVLDRTLALFQPKDFGLDEAHHQGNRIMTRDIISIANSQLPLLLKSLSPNSPNNRSLTLRIFQSILQTECKIFQSDFKDLLSDSPLSASTISYSSKIWEGLYDNFPPDDFDYARMVLCGVLDLTRLEKIVTKVDPMNEPARLEFNKNLSHIKSSTANFLNRISEYDAIVLKSLYSDSTASVPLVFSLFDPFQENYHASADILKQAFGTLEKLKALGGLLSEYFQQSMIAFDQSITQLRDLRTFGTMPRFLKTCENILELFCCPRSGILTLKKIQLNTTNKLLIRQYWNNQWSTLGIIFDNAIKWSQVQEKEIMVDFTRDVMDYAGKLFSEFEVFEKALLDSGDSVTIEIDSQATDTISKEGRQLLVKVSLIVARIASWLRLRDEALLSMCQSLLCRILKKFHQVEIEPESDALDICQNMAVGIRKKYITNMTDQQKAELRIAVSLHRLLELPKEEAPTVVKIEPSVAVEPPTKRLKASVIDLESWASKSRDGVSTPDTSHEKLGKTKAVATSAVTSKADIPPKRTQKGSASGGSALMKDLKAGVRSDVRARGATQSSSITKPITSTEGARLKSLNALLVPQSDKQVRIVPEDDSSSSDEHEDIGNDVFAIPKAIKAVEKPKGPRKTEFIGGSTIFTRGIPLGGPGPRKAQSAADIRARLTPDLTPLFRSVLSWNFFHKGDLPPNSAKSDYTMVTQSFRTPKEYAETFEPLLLLECWQQVMKAREEVQIGSAFDVKVVNRGSADGFIEIQSNIQSNILTSSDIIVLSTSKNPMEEGEGMSCLAMVHTTGSRKATHTEISFRCLPNPEMISAIRPNGSLRGVKVFSLTPIEREYAALKALPYYDLCESIIKGRPHVYIEPEDRNIHRTMKVYRVNKPQAKAIIGVVRNDGFSLIQGPPGTGKTKTVIAVIGALLPDDKGVTISVPGGKSTSPNVIPKKLLVCAPSNAAVDELVVRMKEGVVRQSGDKFTPAVVRLGRLDVINQAVHDVALETLIEKKINLQKEKEDATKGKPGGKPKSLEELRAQMDLLLAERNAKRMAMDNDRAEKRESSNDLREEVNTLSRKIKDLGRELDEVRDQSTTVNRNNDIRRREFMQQVLDEANILCATLSGAGHDTLRNLNIEFETVIIDEAAQSIELSALIPLKFGCKKCIMVGDPKQLPPTVLSREASRFAYEQSLFVRMQKNHPEAVHLLSIQYRMHPEISLFPSQMFYNSQLEDGPNMNKLRSQSWHQSLFFGPYRFFNVRGQESASGHSMKNTNEVDVALMIYKRLVADFPDTDFDGKIGVITPYKTQLQALRQKFAGIYSEEILKKIEFNTTDAFQGREREIIIFSCVRASQKSTVGFLSDIRRMNVGLTRAKSSLFVLGNAETLGKNEFWARLVDDARKRECYTEGNFAQLLKRPCRTTIKQIEKRLSGVSISPSEATSNPSSIPEYKVKQEVRQPAPPADDWFDETKFDDDSPVEPPKDSREESSLVPPKPSTNLNASDLAGAQKKKRQRDDVIKAEGIDADILVNASKSTQASETPQEQSAPPLLAQSTNRPQRPLPGSKGPLPTKKKKKNVEDAMFIKRKPARP